MPPKDFVTCPHLKDNKETMYVPINKLGSTSFVDQLLQINANDKKNRYRTITQPK